MELKIPKYMETKKYDLEERLIEFAIIVSDLIEQFPDTKLANHLGNQGIRSVIINKFVP